MLTFDKIRDMERTERDSRKLQRIPEELTEQLRDYINRKESIKEKTLSDMNELERIRDSIRKIFEMRQKKILDGVFETSTGGRPPDFLTKQETELFERLVDIINGFRQTIFSEMNRKESAPEKAGDERKDFYKVLADLPEFIGPDMKTYKLRKNEIIQISKPLNEFLLKKGVIGKAD
ncbi:MAG: DNA replication complex GINS family protein [Candidatus Aenigmarchaeota archaeon]|nr:DNA replication complex GINS family protein [Candidatus Aenigmarchaeota archaeon]